MIPGGIESVSVDESQLSPEARRVWQRIVNGPRGKVVGPLKVWMQSPEFADLAQDLGRFVRYNTSLPPILSELAIIVTARLWSAAFEWSHHVPTALSAGLPAAIVEAIGCGERPEFRDPQQEAVFDVTVELHRDHTLADETLSRALDVLGRKATVELVGLCGYYGLISMTINAFRIPADHPPPLPETDIPTQNMFRERSLAAC